MADSVGLSMADRVLPLVPMSDVNAWDLPYGAALAGADLLLPDRDLSPPTLARFIAAERASILACVPTALLDLVDYCDAEAIELPSLRLCVCGGSALPPALSRRLQERGIEVRQAWGTTETSAISTVRRQPVPWVELRAVTVEGVVVADGETVGELQARGPWIAAGYFEAPQAGIESLVGGWLPTGEIGTVDEHGCIEVSDRSEDVLGR